MRPVAGVVTAFLALALLAPGEAAADGWHSEQPVYAGLGIPVPLGPVGDVEFWAPNRGLLITGGNDGMPAGLYAYDGIGWHLYSTVCGGAAGRIAWAGPTEFWTISDQRPGQETGTDPSRELPRRSLCHFKDGQVVASYAEPLGASSSYQQMNAAACSGPGDCWFAGERLPGAAANAGAFHLHWDGQSLTSTPSLTEPQPGLNDPGRAVKGLAFHEGQWFESVQAQIDDSVPDESSPSLLHRIVPSSPSPFVPVAIEGLAIGPEQPADLAAFRLSSSGESLWAMGGASSGKAAKVRLLRYDGTTGAFAPVALEDPGAVFDPAANAADQITGFALEPGIDAAWVGFRHRSGEGTGAAAIARLARVHADGSVGDPTLLPSEPEGIGRKGSTGPIACPAAGQCWMATELGWLFHLGGSLPQDTEAAMHVVVNYRPPDNGLPSEEASGLPGDDSGAELPVERQAEEPSRERAHRTRSKALVAAVRQRVLKRTVLELSFTLRAKAHVRLVAKRRKRVVAQTPKVTMGKGRHSLRLQLDPDRWPTKLDFQVHPVRGRAAR